ncbi:mitochondrial import inner membrane translocase subunit TIM50-C-like isoform X2 [Chrysoperla carnea]|uniref:mitochondrial import inner membrane translocase subunit TIM50-C-like isoform X2 n=1 Tax=Chrysoperla carnea TaxID=189513 RepID=UPI001D080557|nr:mitochondrial import inner membrane translocase subunit TIM50-C-like isoform X2 [Chrysoperla carnea]
MALRILSNLKLFTNVLNLNLNKHYNTSSVGQKINYLYFSKYVSNRRLYSNKTDEVNTAKENPSANPAKVGTFTALFQQKPVEESQSNQNEEEENRKNREQAWRTMKYTLAMFGVTFTALGGWLIVEYGAPEVDEHGEVIRDEFSDLGTVRQYFMRMFRQLDYFQKMIKEPSRDKLLPDPPGAPYYQPPYTLVLELTDVLVHPDWTYKTGWRFKKRPGIDQFLQQVGPPLFEVVIFTAETGMTVFPIIEALDPNNIISYKLVRDATHFVDGHHIKNLDKLNRNLSKVIVVDWNANSVKFHPENALRIPKWEGNDDDTTLIDLAAFLKTLAATRIEDVREVLQYYSQFENPLAAFRENQRRLMEQQETQRQIEAQQPKPLTKSWSQTFLRH